jgi:hypothetical protein
MLVYMDEIIISKIFTALVCKNNFNKILFILSMLRFFVILKLKICHHLPSSLDFRYNLWNHIPRNYN